MPPVIDTTFSTICSQLPFDITESKPGLTPSEYSIKGSKDLFELTIVINKAFYLVNPDPLSDAKEVRYISVPVPSIELAQSLINDFVNSLIAVSPPDVAPGIFVVPGNYKNKVEFAQLFSKEIKTAKESQLRWFQALVDMADHTWSQSKSPISISDLERDAARALGYEREWLSPIPTDVLATQTKCPFCQSPINEGAVKCITCHEILDKKRYAELTGAAK